MLAIAKQLQEAHAAMSRKLENSLNVPEHHLLENFMQTVKAAFDVSNPPPSIWSFSSLHLLCFLWAHTECDHGLLTICNTIHK